MLCYLSGSEIEVVCLTQLVFSLSPVEGSTRCVSVMAGKEKDAGKRDQCLLNEGSINF